MHKWYAVQQPCGHICIGVDDEQQQEEQEDEVVEIIRWDRSQDVARPHACVRFAFAFLNSTQVAYMVSSSAYRSPLCLIHYCATTCCHACIEFGSERMRVVALIVFILYLACASMLALITQNVYIACMIIAYAASTLMFYY